MFAKIQSIIIYCPLKIHFWHCPLFGARTDDVRVNGRRNARIGFVFLCRGLQLEMFRMLLNESNYRYNNRYNECNNLNEKYWYIFSHCIVFRLFLFFPKRQNYAKPNQNQNYGPARTNQTHINSALTLYSDSSFCAHIRPKRFQNR